MGSESSFTSFQRLLLGAIVVTTVIGALTVAELLAEGSVVATEIRKGVVTLVFATVIGGIAKLLIDDINQLRAQRGERARFFQAVLDDLKSVYDRVERARHLIVAHQSAKALGEEFRDLINSNVVLANVKRALAEKTAGIPEDKRQAIEACVTSMECFLNVVIDEFDQEYKRIADRQRIYEADMTTYVETAEPERPRDPPINTAWESITSLNLFTWLVDHNSDPSDDPRATRLPRKYRDEFVAPLDRASKILRDLLVGTLARRWERR